MTDLKKSNWKRGYPIKKAFLIILWFFVLFLIIKSIMLFTSKSFEIDNVVFFILLILVDALTFLPIKKYVSTKNQCIPYLNKLLSNDEICSLLENEKFVLIDELKGSLWYKKISESENWLCINNRYVSKTLLAIISVLTTTVATNNHSMTRLEIMYITGDGINIDTGLGKIGKQYEILKSYIKEKTDIIPVNLGVHSHRFGKEFKRILKKEQFKNLRTIELFEHAREIKEIVMK